MLDGSGNGASDVTFLPLELLLRDDLAATCEWYWNVSTRKNICGRGREARVSWVRAGRGSSAEEGDARRRRRRTRRWRACRRG